MPTPASNLAGVLFWADRSPPQAGSYSDIVVGNDAAFAFQCGDAFDLG